jgi:putative oxidoreductase
MDRAAPYLILIGRVVLSIIFIQAGWSKIFGYAGTVEHMNAAGVPGALLPLVILVELGGGLLVVLGLVTRYAESPLPASCVLSAWFFHYQPGDMGQMINFMKEHHHRWRLPGARWLGPRRLGAGKSAPRLGHRSVRGGRYSPHGVAHVVGDEERA